MRKHLKTFATALILLSLCSLIYFVALYSPQLNSIEKLKSDIQETSQDIETQKKEIDQLQLLKQNLIQQPTQKNLSQKLASSSGPSVPQWIQNISVESNKRNIQMLRFEPHSPETQDVYEIQNFDVEVEGVFLQVLGFIDKIRNDDKVLAITAVDIAVASEFSQNQKVIARFQLTHYQRRSSVE
ncbi:MAG: type 4a pilus biogenesis protein PilO [Deltaproteobacteria bacterium]|nr:type 4a pilus biogenesis protein PilO [Deltaproteobacteria bacterium]